MLAVVTEEKSNTAASSKTTLVSTRRSRRLKAKKMLPPITLKKVEVKIMKIDPNLIFGLLEDSANEDREERVAGKILQTKKESSHVLRQRKAATPKPARAKD